MAKGVAGEPGNRKRGGRGQNAAPERSERKPKRADRGYVERAAVFYLERFSSTTGHLAVVLRRKVARRSLADGVSQEEVEGWIAEVVEKMVRLGYVDDQAFARARARSLRDRGRPERAIRNALAQKLVPRDLIDDAIDNLGGGETSPDLLAAVRYVRRRRIGPARRPDMVRPSDDPRRLYQRDLAAMARAGFSLDDARQVLDLEDIAALDDFEAELDMPQL